MDLLKKASTNPEQCLATNTKVRILDKEYDGKQPVSLPAKTSKEYSLSSVVFYLLHSELSLKEYVTLCKNEGISPISYLDRAPIQSCIENYTPTHVNGFFIKPKYERETPYEILSSSTKAIVSVPDSIVSKIHIGNIERLLKDGVLDPTPYNPLCQKKVEFTIDGLLVEARSDLHNLSDEEWGSVRGVFADTGDYFNGNNLISRVPSTATIFTLSDEKFKSIRILFQNNKVRNLNEIISVLKT